MTSEDSIGQIREHSRLLMRELDVLKGVFLDTGFTYAQCHLLFELSRHKSLNPLQLSENLLLDKSNTSRMVKRLVELGLIRSVQSQVDQRQRDLSLSAKGRKLIGRVNEVASQQVADGLALLTQDQQQAVVEGLGLYSNALRKVRLQADFEIRPVRASDDAQVAATIRTVMAEFGAVGEGYSIADPEVDSMHANYLAKGSGYYVVVRDDRVVGCGGFARLVGGRKTTCELRKMFFLPEIRGLGLGRKLINRLLNEAKLRGYKECYIETLVRMESANGLYQSVGFQQLDQPMGNTGHCSCDRRYLLEF